MSKVKLPKEFRTKWLKALTNGSYKQTSSMLVETIEGQKNKYCCLGVACRIEGIPVKELKDVIPIPEELKSLDGFISIPDEKEVKDEEQE